MDGSNMDEKLTKKEAEELVERVRYLAKQNVLTKGDRLRIYAVLSEACDRGIAELKREVGVVDATGGKPQ